MKSSARRFALLVLGTILFTAANGVKAAATAVAAAATPAISDDRLASTTAQPPIEVLATRIIYDEGRPSASLAVRNRGDIDYLVALAVEPFAGVGHEAGKTTDDFMCAPAFRILHPGETFPFRIVRLAKALPEDVESLYVAALRILPSSAHLTNFALAETAIELSMAGRFKLFYRPKALAGAFGVEEARERLTARCGEGELLLSNPSPYWGTFASASFEGRNLLQAGPKPMIAPSGELRLESGPCRKGSRLRFSFLAETGIETPVQEIQVE